MARGHLLAMHLRGAYLALHRQAQDVFAPFGITADQFVLLTLLAEKDAAIQQDLVRRSASDPNTVRAMLILLEKLGLVQRRRHRHDGRARTVHLTAKGRRLQGKLMVAARTLHEVISAALPDSDWRTVVGCFDRVAASMAQLRQASRRLKQKTLIVREET